MFFATTNPGKQLLLVTYVGQVTAEELRRGREEADVLMASLSPGFTVLADMERIDTMDRDCAQEMGRLMELCEEKGMGTVIRVIRDPGQDIGLNIISAFHYSRKPTILTCQKMVEALKTLNL